MLILWCGFRKKKENAQKSSNSLGYELALLLSLTYQLAFGHLPFSCLAYLVPGRVRADPGAQILKN